MGAFGEVSCPSLPRTKSPPKKWRIWAEVGFCGVGASGSTAATTNFWPALAVMIEAAKVGGPRVSGTMLNENDCKSRRRASTYHLEGVAHQRSG